MYASARTSLGLVREINQDCHLVWELSSHGRTALQVSFCIVADGMGGGAAGDRASSLAVQAASESVAQGVFQRTTEVTSKAFDALSLLHGAVDAANHAVKADADQHPSREGMGTTLTAGLMSAGVMFISHVGDSRCYRLRGGVLRQLTEDHSLVGEMVRLGHLSGEDARRHPRRNIITRALGLHDEIAVEMVCDVVEEHDLYLFCSDGLWGSVADSQIREILQRPSAFGGTRGRLAIDAAADRLVQLALDAGGEDNITVLIGRVEACDIHQEAATIARSVHDAGVCAAREPAGEWKRTLRYRPPE